MVLTYSDEDFLKFLQVVIRPAISKVKLYKSIAILQHSKNKTRFIAGFCIYSFIDCLLDVNNKHISRLKISKNPQKALIFVFEFSINSTFRRLN